MRSRLLLLLAAMIAINSKMSGGGISPNWEQSGNAAFVEKTEDSVSIAGTNIESGIHTLLNVDGSSHNLRNEGDTLVFTGTLSIDGKLAGQSSHSGALRFGLFNSAEIITTSGWTGYLALLDTAGTGGTPGGVFLRSAGNNSNFWSGTGIRRATTFESDQPSFLGGESYSLRMTLTKLTQGIRVEAVAKNKATSAAYLISSHEDSSSGALAFNRLGIYAASAGGGVGADFLSLTNVEVTLTAVSEAGEWSLFAVGAGFLQVLRRRRHTIRRGRCPTQ